MTRLTLLVFPQSWDGAGKLRLRVVVLPKGNPLAPLDLGAGPPFATAALRFDALIATDAGVMPQPGGAQHQLPLPAMDRPFREALFVELRDRQFHIVGPVAPPATTPRIKKALMSTYRAAANVTRSRTPFAVEENAYHCMLEDSPQPPPPAQPPAKDISWGQVMGYALRQPRLAEALGLVYEAEIEVPAGAFDSGGWLFAGLDAASAYAGQADFAASYAARVPRLRAGQPRPLFAAVLFPVSVAPAGGYDAVFPEAVAYDDGFAKIVHGAQPVSSGLIDTSPARLPAVRDLGIRLGWDDEQILIWLNRQLGIDPFTGNPSPLAARMGVAAYRVDVRAEGDQAWSSLVRARGGVALGDIDLGLFEGELGVEAVPVNLQNQAGGEFWLPPYFAVWAGGSVVVSDPAAYRLVGLNSVADGQRYQAVEADLVPLRYGSNYELRVRLMDISGGGPDWTRAPVNPAPKPFARVPFRRYLPPRAVTVSGPGMAVDGRSASFEIDRPRLGYPAAFFTGSPEVMAALEADRDLMSALHAQDPQDPRLRELGIPDPDVQRLEISVEVRSLDGDPKAPGGFVKLFSTSRQFPADPAASLHLDFTFEDAADVASMPAPAAGGAIALPTARELRVSLVAAGREDPGLDYFGSEEARRGATATPLAFRAPVQSADGLLVPEPETSRLQGILLQPDALPSSNAGASRAAEGRQHESSSESADLLARQLGLSRSGLAFSGTQGRRTVFGASAALRHSLSPDRSTIVFGANTELTARWLMVLRVSLARDWTWDGVQSPGFEVVREGHGVVGMIHLPRVLGSGARADGDRTTTDLVFFDAIDPKVKDGEFPAELEETYTLRAIYREPTPDGQATWSWPIRLPVAARPVQTPRLVSAGLAFSPYEPAPDYSSTNVRNVRLWLEFDGKPRDPHDTYFVRVLAYAPDPLLMAIGEEPTPEPPEPALPIDEERIRVIRAGQPADLSGYDAMQPLTPAPDGVHDLVPLPPGLDETSLDLFGLYVCELRVGHDKTRWCTAQSRFGPPLRVTGVQHPAPPLVCQVDRTKNEAIVAGPYATPVLRGRHLRPAVPRTDLWVLVYAQVAQLDGQGRRNVLLLRQRASPPRPGEVDLHHDAELSALGVARFDFLEIIGRLERLGLPRDAPLSVVMVEVITEHLAREDGRPRQDPLGAYLGEVRILRTSPLTPVPAGCFMPE